MIQKTNGPQGLSFKRVCETTRGSKRFAVQSTSEESLFVHGAIREDDVDGRRAKRLGLARLRACGRATKRFACFPDQARATDREGTARAARFEKALAANAKAAATFKNFAPSHRRAYLDWISEARRPATRERRLHTTIEWLTEGKPQNRKYLEQRAAK